MSVFRSVQFAVGLLVLSAAPLAAQTGSQQMPPAPKPGPEHEVFKLDEGTWDAVVEFVMAPGQPPMMSKGVEVNTIGCGGLCLITDFKGEMMGGSFQGHGLVTWDIVKKKYVGSWTDSMSGGLAITEATHDPAKKQISGWMEGPDASGKVMKMRSVSEYKDGTRVMTGFGPGPDGKEMQMMKITYTKRK